MEHRGGHLPFEAELTEQHISFDKPNLITVAVNNTLTPATVPQGFVNFKTGDKYVLLILKIHHSSRKIDTTETETDK